LWRWGPRISRPRRSSSPAVFLEVEERPRAQAERGSIGRMRLGVVGPACLFGPAVVLRETEESGIGDFFQEFLLQGGSIRHFLGDDFTADHPQLQTLVALGERPRCEGEFSVIRSEVAHAHEGGLSKVRMVRAVKIAVVSDRIVRLVEGADSQQVLAVGRLPVAD